ncbi:MAG: Gfo/Idh/MocA family oxidoreductase [Planctomycetota bacterium]
MKLRIGLIGLGASWQTMHRPALRMLADRFDIRAIYSNVSKLAENAVAEFQADPVEGFQAVVRRGDIDAVLILETAWLKHLPAIAACQAGKAVYWAGDLAFDPVRDASFRQCVDESGVAFMTQLPRRFSPATLRLKELIATSLGAPRLLFCHHRMTVDLQARQAASQRARVAMETNGETISAADSPRIEQELIELIDWCNYVVGSPPASVVATGQDSDPSLKYQALSLLYGGNQADATANSGRVGTSVQAQISCGNYIPPSWQEAIGFRPPAALQVVCERGVAFLDLPGTLVWFDDVGRHHESLEMEAPVGEKLLSQFHRSITSLVRNLTGLDDAYRAAAILKAARRSMCEGRRMDLADAMNLTGSSKPSHGIA